MAAIVGSQLAPYLRTRTIPLPLDRWRLITANAIPNTAANGGLMSADTAPIFERVNGATDKQLRIRWAATVVIEITTSFMYPLDLDPEKPLVIKLLANMSAAADTPVLGVNYFENVGDTNAGGNTAALSATLTPVSVTIAAADIGAPYGVATVGIIPAAHGTDAIHFYGGWVEYQITPTKSALSTYGS